MGTVFLYSLCGGLLAVVSTGRTDQIAWRFLRLVAWLAFALVALSLAWELTRAAPGTPKVSLTTSSGAFAGLCAFALSVLAPRAARKPLLFRVLAVAGAIAGFAASVSAAGPGAGAVAGSTGVQWALAGGRILGGLLLGSITVAWLLGHAYLTATRMTIAPLRHFSRLLSLAVGVRIVFVLASLVIGQIAGGGMVDRLFDSWLIVTLRVGVGLVAVAVFAYMVADCVKLRSTQSATGILYFGSVFAYVGELASQQLAQQWGWPV